MNKEELVKEVSKKAKASQKATADILAATLETIQKTVSKGKKVTFLPFETVFSIVSNVAAIMSAVAF